MAEPASGTSGITLGWIGTTHCAQGFDGDDERLDHAHEHPHPPPTPPITEKKTIRTDKNVGTGSVGAFSGASAGSGWVGDITIKSWDAGGESRAARWILIGSAINATGRVPQA